MINIPTEINCTDGEPWTVWSWSDVYEDVRSTVRDYVADYAADYTDDPYPGVTIDEDTVDGPELWGACEDAWESWIEPAVDRIMAGFWSDYDEDDPASWRFSVGESPNTISFWFVKEK